MLYGPILTECVWLQGPFKEARPLVLRLWLDNAFGEHVATTEPFLLRYAGRSGGALSIDRPTDADWG